MKGAVVGYASIDRSILVDRMPAPGRTSRVMRHLGDSSRSGGIAHTLRAMLNGGLEAAAVCAVGSDPDGVSYVEGLSSLGCNVDGIVIDGPRSPSSDLIYGPNGETACVFDAGGDWDHLTPAQEAAIAASDLLVVMIGPPVVTTEALALARDDQMIAWVVKVDPSSHDTDLAHGLGQRADIVFHNEDEAPMVNRALAEAAPIVVTTDGPRAVRVTSGGETNEYPVPRLDVVGNPTGAGDAFAGGYLAPWLLGEQEAKCVAAGVESAARLLGGYQ